MPSLPRIRLLTTGGTIAGAQTGGDARGYRAKAEEAAWSAKDPIPRLGKALVAAGRAAPEALAQIEAEVTAQLDDAVAFARQSPDPAPERAFEDALA